jgi:hypothetical protein
MGIFEVDAFENNTEKVWEVRAITIILYRILL